MRFAWAPVLFAVLALPVMVAIYLRRQRRRRPAVVYPSLDLVRAALPRRAGWKRHVKKNKKINNKEKIKI